MLGFHINMAEGILTEDGIALGEDLHGAKVLEAAKAYLALEQLVEQTEVPVNEHITRREDMGTGRLQLFRQEDGDICIAVVDSEGQMAGIEFCTSIIGGGRSPRVLAALYGLARAMIEDSKAHPLPDGFNCP